MLTHLGENIADREEASLVTQHYLDVTNRILTAQLPTEISVKLTQLGLDLDAKFCYENLSALIENTPADKVLWIDMEQSPYVDATIELYRRARTIHANVGICLQAYLYRTEKDLDTLIPMGAAIRLVKGAYNEPAEIAYPLKKDVDENYLHLVQSLLSPEARRARVRAAIATHDRSLIAKITEWADIPGRSESRNSNSRCFTASSAPSNCAWRRPAIARRVLIAYGSFWYPWFMRRLAERPANVLFLARNFFSN